MGLHSWTVCCIYGNLYHIGFTCTEEYKALCHESNYTKIIWFIEIISAAPYSLLCL